MNKQIRTLRTAGDIVDEGFVTPAERAALEKVAARYAVALPPALAALIDRGDARDPIALQFVPDAAELETTPDELADPIGDEAHSPVEGIVHRYPDRVLLKLTHVCAVYCRFCFRREMVGPDKPNALSPEAVKAALDYIRDHQEIWEVILTGGDPLILSPRRLRAVMKELGAIDHVKVVRLHTRMPVAEPSRITPDLVRALKTSGNARRTLAVYVAVHVNHARELTPEARAACARMADAGIPLLGQSVLLKGVNDSAEAMRDLMRACVESRIKPYYLHHGDLAPGTAHLRTDIATGQNIMRELRGRVSGLCQPSYVLDIPGGHGKSPLGPNYLETVDGGYEIEDFTGRRHAYR
ncbi:lysine 2,3-aminomutase [Pseudolabrys sp. Root1462]|uniref:lysine-2,3-aminomutase-like protein n=1 Tax=Pseudolabrys sp. Root1462 TaxID=1736466 RepID=UPI0007034D89|nr:lysine-2,3-aminomutase-like protein [Pseudolabrys sp. Root1462]KQZ00780.1 lysine 2,3-aminomutase [Pseudolabrys sp. Root1462]